ncbi:MAG TPA: thiamine pyrophosphate-binding protein, partial [Dehalococcoidia bacterium]|nr:thiamine pyrophosphate-binding protein [Dehalococcoidia bacterium]
MSSFADVVAATLEQAGVEFIFGVPGSLSSVELIEAASKRGIRYILCSNESSAAVMAGVYGVMCRRPGVVSTGVGPGAAAAVHGAAHLFLERAPALILTDRFGEADYLRLPRQRLDQPALYRAVTKGSFTLAAIDTAATLRRAIDLALSGRPGPVHVDLPYDLMQAPAPEAALASGPPPKRRFAPAGESAALRELAEAIDAARRPAVVAGLQVNRSGSDAEVAFVRFVERLGAPVFATMAAKGTLPEDHPLAAGTFRNVASERALLDRADAIVLVGVDPVELFSASWPYEAPVFVLDEAPYVEGPYSPALEIVADLASSLEVLARLVTPHSGWNREDVEAYKQARESALRPSGPGLMPAAVVRIARERLPRHGILTVDAGQHKVLTTDLWTAGRPGGFHTSSGLGSMAVAIPAAIAAKLVEPQTPVLCLTGDGGF